MKFAREKLTEEVRSKGNPDFELRESIKISPWVN